MCGILGLYGYGDILEDMHPGLMKIQHRGQDAVGVGVYREGSFFLEKESGLVQEFFSRHTFSAGEMALGHVRYGTAGSGQPMNSQPFYTSSPFGIAICHNGNITNNAELQEMLLASENPRQVNSTSDSETLLEVLANELYLRSRLFASDFPKALFSAIEGVMVKVKGSYSVLGIIMGKGFFAFRDPFGIKPIVFGKKVESRGASYAFASESVALDALGYASVDNLRPGEALFIDMERTVTRKSILREEHRPCVFEYIYFASPASVIDGISVSIVRSRLGETLGKAWRRHGLEADCVLVVPSSATHSALGMARELGIPFEMGIMKNHYVGRSFIEATKARRDMAVRLKLDIDRSAVNGRRVIVVDDSIVRGTTSRYLVRMLREAGCEKVYFVSSAPPIMWPCVYGIDMSIKKELIAANNSCEEICRFLGADMLLYQSMDDLRNAVRLPAYCDACFTGRYPTEVSPGILKKIELGRIQVKDLLEK